MAANNSPPLIVCHVSSLSICQFSCKLFSGEKVLEQRMELERHSPFSLTRVLDWQFEDWKFLDGHLDEENLAVRHREMSLVTKFCFLAALKIWCLFGASICWCRKCLSSFSAFQVLQMVELPRHWRTLFSWPATAKCFQTSEQSLLGPVLRTVAMSCANKRCLDPRSFRVNPFSPR